MICECGNHAWRPLTRGFTTLVSPEDEYLLEESWYASATRRGYIAVRRNLPQDESGRRRQERLSRRVTNAPEDRVVDHINLNTLDNRRENLRVCAEVENRLNKPARKGKAVGLKGVRLSSSANRYDALITRDKRQFFLGSFDTPQEAHAAYVGASKVLHGEFARAQ